MSTELLDGWLSLSEFAAKINKHPRTVSRWARQRDGLPIARQGITPFIHVPTYQRWMLSRLR
jgi:hypothetical protein